MVQATTRRDCDSQQDEQEMERMLIKARQEREYTEYSTMPNEVRIEQAIKHKKEAMMQDTMQEVKLARQTIRNIIEEHSIVEIKKFRNDMITSTNQNKK